MMGMEAVRRGSNPQGIFGYALKGGEMIGGNMAGTTKHDLSAEFLAVSQSRPDIKKMVWHQSLRLPKGETLSPEKWVELGNKYMKKMGYSDTHQRIYVMHNDRKGQHIHIIANRVGVDGQIYLGRNENLLSSKLCRVLEKEYGLTQIKEDPARIKRKPVSQGEKGMGDRLDEIPIKIRIQHEIDVAAKDKPAFSVFIERLEARGVSVSPNGKTGQCSGVSFVLDGEARSGTDLGHSYKFGQLVKRLDFDKLRDQPIIDDLRKKAITDREDSKGDLSPVSVLDALPQPYKGPKRTLDLAFSAQDGGVYAWKTSGVTAIIDNGISISVQSTADSAIKAGLQLAKEKGWASVKVTGNAEFRRKSWLAGSAMGMKIEGYEPTSQDRDDLASILKLKQEKAHDRKNSGNEAATGVQRQRDPDSRGLGATHKRHGDNADSPDGGARDAINDNKGRHIQDPRVDAEVRGGDKGDQGQHERDARQPQGHAARRETNSSADRDATDNRNASGGYALRRVGMVRDAVKRIVVEWANRKERSDTARSDKRAKDALQARQRAASQKVRTERVRRIVAVENSDGVYQSIACKLVKLQEQKGFIADWAEVDRKTIKAMMVDLRPDADIKAIVKAGSPEFSGVDADTDDLLDSIISDVSTDSEVIMARKAQEAAEAANKVAKTTQDQEIEHEMN